MLLTLLISPMAMRGQSDYSTDYTGNIELSTTGGSNASTCSVIISDNPYAGIKAGTSSKTGAVMITVPSGTKYLHMHVAAWNGTTVSLSVTPEGYSDNIALTNNSGISGNTPFTFDGDPSTSDYYKVVTFSDALTVDTELTFTAVGGKRFVVWGVTSEEEGGTSNPSITASNIEIDYNITSGAIAYTINNPVAGGSLSATTTADWLTPGTAGNVSVPFTCEANQGAERSAIVALTYTYNTNQTVTKNVTVTQAGNPDAVDNIEDITATGTYTVRGTIVAKSTRGFIVGDGTGYVYYYNTNYSQSDYNIGDKVKIAGAISVYGGVYEFTSSATVTAATVSNYQTENPTVLTGEDMDARVASTTPPQLSSYVQYEGILTISGTHYNITDIDGAETAIGSISYPTDTDFTSLDGKQVKVTGYYVGISTSTYYNTMLGSIEEVIGSDPYITANDVDIDYSATSGSIAYTIGNPVSGGVTTASAAGYSWFNVGTVSTGSVAFTCEANQGAERSATVTLTYTYNTNQTVTKNVTVTQAGNPNVVDNISDITAAGTYTVQGTIVAKSQRGFIVGDGTGYVYYYNQNYDQADYEIGDIVKLAGSVVAYGGVFEFNSSTTITTETISGYVTENPTILTGEEMDARVASTTPAQLSSYVQYEGTLTISGNYYNITNIAGATTAKGSISFPIETSFSSLNGKTVLVKGYYVGISSSQYYNTMIGSIEEVVNPDPSITVAPATVNAPYTGADGSLTITYQNIPDLISFDIQFCDANGEALTGDDPDWIYAEITAPTGTDNYLVSYIIDDNDGEARTAYFKVYTFVDNDGVYSNLVTINQAQYVVDYAVLPFEFDGGKADIATTDGLTQEGLDSDYSSSPKLKFNSTGDYVLLKFNEEPGALTFDIKGNGFSGGTFTVQTSEDGETYTDLWAYTDLGAVQNEIFENLGENVRYIKWIYTNKDQGNVALGNIHLYEAGGGPVVETYNLTVEPYENLEIFVFVEDENNPGLEEAGTIQVTEGDQVMLSVTANEGYVMQSLMVDGVEHVNDIDEAETYTFIMPGHDVIISATAVEDVPFEPATYTLANSIESGKSYIIVGQGDGNYYAMGYQRNNNRHAVEISVDEETATVSTADVYEFTISELAAAGFYSIYDARTPGYLYAASSSGNQLKTESELDEDGNGDWEITFNTDDGSANVVASNSSNRNVMQYNNQNTIFSCYASDSQHPVFLYVKVETPTTITQTIELNAGSNWVSFVVETDMTTLREALVAALPDTEIMIKSAYQSCTYKNNRWSGQLKTLNLSNMYLIKVVNSAEITLEGMPIGAAALPVAINSGTNWIAYPLLQSMSVQNIFSGFAVNNDMVKGPVNSATYKNGRWSGQLKSLEPGKGYLYKSAATESRVFTFPVNK